MEKEHKIIFFQLPVSKREKTNIRFYYIKIKKYINGGIQFHGDKENFEKWNGYNTIYGCYLDSIGNKWYPNAHFGYGAIDFFNSDYNVIQLNHFIHCENVKADGHMHGVYLASSSDHNLVEHNDFYLVSGDAVRIRDYSNYNVITLNDIKRSGNYSYYSTYRDLVKEECKSWENEFRNNTCNCGYSGSEIQLFTYGVRYVKSPGDTVEAQENYDTHYRDYCHGLSRWLYTSGNQRLCSKE